MPDDSRSEWISAPGLKVLNVRCLRVFTHNPYMSVCEMIAVSVPKVVSEISSAQCMDSKEE